MKWKGLLIVTLYLAMTKIEIKCSGSEAAPSQETQRKCVILLHGLSRTSLSMKRLEWNLRNDGYQVINLSYPSRRLSVEQIATTYVPFALSKISNNVNNISFVTHSMGGIILRQYLSQHTITNLGRVVMLAPPNHGSELVDMFRRHSLGRWILGPAGRELGTDASDLPQRLGEAHFEVGIIAGDRSLNPWFSWIIPCPDDGKVSVGRTKLPGMSDFIVVHNSHTWMTWRMGTIRQVLIYLRDGHFVKAAPPSRRYDHTSKSVTRRRRLKNGVSRTRSSISNRHQFIRRALSGSRVDNWVRPAEIDCDVINLLRGT
jgi:triacylglycerol lipase